VSDNEAKTRNILLCCCMLFFNRRCYMPPVTASLVSDIFVRVTSVM